MANMQSFTLWFLENIPDFLLSEPICYFVAIAFMLLIIRIILSFRR